MDAKTGAKKTATKKQRPVAMAVSPVRPPCMIPEALSINAVTGEHPRNEPIDMKAASVQ
jgi:hypothetical protein